jgi:hypothetical protein
MIVLGPAALIVALVEVGATLLGTRRHPNVELIVVWSLFGVFFLYAGPWLFLRRHAINTEYVITDDGIAVSERGSLDQFVNWSQFTSARIHPLAYTVELWAPQLNKPVVLLNSAHHGRRFQALRSHVKQKLGSKVEIRYP